MTVTICMIPGQAMMKEMVLQEAGPLGKVAQNLMDHIPGCSLIMPETICKLCNSSII